MNDRSDDAPALLAEFVRTWDCQFPRAEAVHPSAVTPLLIELNRLIRRARALGQHPSEAV
jgi:hypothetical protein